MLDLRRHFPSKFGHFLIKWDRTARQGAPVFFMAFSVAPGSAGLHLATLGKSELIGRVARSGPLPRKSFSMGEADEKRFYLEARRIRA